MGERKVFPANPKQQYRVSQCGERDPSAYNEKIGDDNEHPSLTYFTDERYLQVKWWKEKPFLQIQSINITYPNVKNMIVVPITKRMEINKSVQVCPISR